MDALELLDKEDLSESKIPRGQQKLLLKSLQPRQATEAEQTTDKMAEVTEATTVATATCEDGATAPGRDQAAGTGPASETECDVYTQLMYEHLRTMQGATATTPTPQPVARRGHTGAATVAASRFERCATMPGLWQDPQVHLVSSATGRSCNVHYDVVDFIAKDTVEEEVVA